MAKAKLRGLGTKGWLDRAIERYGSVKVVAEKLGRAPSTISDIRSGKRPGANLRDAARDLAQGKRAPVAAPPSKGRPEKQSKGVKTLAKAGKQLSELDKKGIDKVVVYVNKPGAGRSFTLGAHGGIDIDQILGAPSVGEFLAVQSARQNYGLEDFDLIDSIEFEEYD